MSQAELDCAHAWLKQREVVKAYVFLLGLEQRLFSLSESKPEVAHLVKVLNALILARWSDSGLQSIKKGAWKAYERSRSRPYDP